MLPVSGQGWSITGIARTPVWKSVNAPSWVFNHVTIAHLSKLTIRCLLITLFSHQFYCSITLRVRVRDIVNEMTDSHFNSQCFFQFPSLLLALAVFFTIPYITFFISFPFLSAYVRFSHNATSCRVNQFLPAISLKYYFLTMRIIVERWMLHSEKAIFTLVCCLIIRIFLIQGKQKKNQYRC